MPTKPMEIDMEGEPKSESVKVRRQSCRGARLRNKDRAGNTLKCEDIGGQSIVDGHDGRQVVLALRGCAPSELC